MKKIYSLILMLGISGFSFAQTLSQVLANVNANYTTVTAQIPSMYTFAYDGINNNISDGGNDMYDGGNYLNTNLGGGINYSNNAVVSHAAFGTTGAYFTRHLPGLFVMVADLDNVNSFSISGNNGADGGGSVDSYTFTTTVNCEVYNVFVKRVYNAFDPSINQVMIVPQNPSASHSFSTNTDNSQHDLTNISASQRIYYILYAGSSGLFIDNPTTETIVNTFLQLTGGTVSGAVATPGTFTSNISWNDLGGGTNWNVEYGLQGFPYGSGTVVNTSSPSAVLSGLDPLTTYDYYINATDGSCTGVLGPLSFTTLEICPVPTSPTISGLTPTTATLNWNAGGMETKWDVEWDTQGFVLGTGNQDYTLLANSDPLTSLTGSTDYHWYVRAVCDLNLGDGVDTASYFVGPLLFTTPQACANPSSLSVSNNTGFATDLNWSAGGTEVEWNIVWGETGFVPGGTGSTAINGVTTLPVTVNGLTPNTSYQFYVQAVCGVGPDQQSMWVGPYTWNTIVYCQNPTSLTSTAYTTTSATLNWNAGGIETSWNVEYGESGFTLGTGTAIVAGGTSLAVGSLDPGTTYCYYVQAKCGVGSETWSTWSGPHCFTTLIACPEPTNLGVINITNTAANLLWQAGGTETSWDIEVGLPGFAPGTGEEEVSASAVTDNPYYVTGLNPSNSYQFYVRGNCGGTDGSSDWAGPYSFNTLLINDVPCDAIELGVDGVVRVYSNALATYNGEPNVPMVTDCNLQTGWCGYGAENKPMWFKFKATATGSAYISTLNSVTSNYNNHTEIAVYSVGLCETYATYSLLAANTGSNWNIGSGTLSDPGSEGLICSGLVPGETYYLMVDAFTGNQYGWGGTEYTASSAPFGISISALPAAEAGTPVAVDACVDATVDLFDAITGQSSNTGTWYNPSVAPGNDVPSTLDLTGVPAGTYPFFYVIDNGACGYDEVETAITIEEGPSAGMDNTVTACNSGDIYLLQYLAGFPYSGGTWTDDDATGALVNGIFESNMFVNGTYDFTYTVAGSGTCPPASATVTINLNDCVGLGIDGNTATVLSAYPNPVMEVLTLQNLNIEAANLDIYDVQGKLIRSIQLNNVKGNYELNMSAFESGVYVVRISTEESIQEVRVVKQ